jgi:hypothetical protein
MRGDGPRLSTTRRPTRQVSRVCGKVQVRGENIKQGERWIRIRDQKRSGGGRNQYSGPEEVPGDGKKRDSHGVAGVAARVGAFAAGRAGSQQQGCLGRQILMQLQLCIMCLRQHTTDEQAG